MVDHVETMPCPHETTIALMGADMEYLKTGQIEFKEEVKEMREDIGNISVTTAEIKTLVLNGRGKKENGSVSNKVLVWVIVGLTSIIMGILGLSIPF